MAMTAIERKALFKAAVTLRETTMADAAAELGVSYNHLILVLRGDRVGSVRLETGIAEFVNRPVRDLFATVRAASSRKSRAGKPPVTQSAA